MTIAVDLGRKATKQTNSCRKWCKRVQYCSRERVTFNVLLFTQGGMKAVVWTDVFQSVVMIAGLLAILIQVLKFMLLSQ